MARSALVSRLPTRAAACDAAPPAARRRPGRHASAAAALRHVNESASPMPGQTRIASAAAGNFA
ncbi:hypothetical protein CFB52_030645 [Burkholderia sp. AU18528]|nr:hypothetical protein CFB52_030645 [Burkholderia sp. AU18528]